VKKGNGYLTMEIRKTKFGNVRAEDKRKQKRFEHEERMKVRDNLTPKQQIKRLDKRLGKNIGAKKERARLLKEIENA